MKKFPLEKAYTLLEPGPVVLVTTADNGKQNILTLSWTMVMDFTPQFAFLTGPWNYSYKAENVSAPLIKECYANIECRIVDHIQKHNIFILDGLAAWVDSARAEKRCFHAIGDGRFRVDGELINHRRIMLAKLPSGV